MPRALAELVEDFYTGKLDYRAFERAAKTAPPAPAWVTEHLGRAYESRDTFGLAQALLVAQALPDRSYTALLCSIALDEGWLQGCQEMALEVLVHLEDPASFDSLVRLCARAGLKGG